ncbi:ABC transporter [Candidatus Phytoplasma solani]|uniref:ABC transporter n=1 Tax=Candidatus Phytoplasma solani TaxID=69896 RepID=UPI0003B7C4FF|nr:ABC transporter [Candidatus Phytoplasma solani]CCP88340.1 ABC-type uncharacterized transport system subunit [Candidatus Phytoplasma solani]
MNSRIEKRKKIIKIATPFSSTFKTLQKAKNLIQEDFELEVFSEQQLRDKFQTSCNDALVQGIVDVTISNNFHTMTAYNEFINCQNQKKLEFIVPFFHPKYGLYINNKNELNLKTLEDVKKHMGLRVLFAPFNDIFTAPCDFSRSLLLLKKLNLIQIDDEVIKQKGYDLNLDHIKNIYDFVFIKTNNIIRVAELFSDYKKYDLAINCPGLMKNNPNFKRIGSIGVGEKEEHEPSDIAFTSYAIILTSRKDNKNDVKTNVVKEFLQKEEVKEIQFKEGGQIDKDYIMINNPEQLKEDILKCNFKKDFFCAY